MVDKNLWPITTHSRCPTHTRLIKLKEGISVFIRSERDMLNEDLEWASWASAAITGTAAGFFSRCEEFASFLFTVLIRVVELIGVFEVASTELHGIN